MKDTERKILIELRRALLHLHKALLEWERGAYEREHGRLSASELLTIIVRDPQFAWLRPITELIVRIDGALESGVDEAPVDVDGLVVQARALAAPDDASGAYAQRYHPAALVDIATLTVPSSTSTSLRSNRTMESSSRSVSA